eukprot:TRINITY_DN3823_c0_g2_i1.p1 TRINITY_DN3823_c0_g2~~TRINITY_DN3823_c0_g2_i1.p1  ORF type:complete len:189 (-),score=54.46 TRINITY_DN3823_c0_g2_i1:95-661(-)
MSEAKSEATKKILVIFCHPKYESSKHGKALLEALTDAKLTNVTIRNLNDLYGSNQHIDSAGEQILWETHDRIILQFPTNWSGVPWLMKKYLDTILVAGWFYGNGGYKCEGKSLSFATTTWGTAEMWRAGGFYGFTIDESFRHLQNLAGFGKMKYLTPYAVNGCWNGLTDFELQDAAIKYVDWIKKLSS